MEMTWTEGTLKICDDIIICGGYSGICTFILMIIIVILYLVFVCRVTKLAFDTLAYASRRVKKEVLNEIKKYEKKRDI